MSKYIYDHFREVIGSKNEFKKFVALFHEEKV